MNKSTNNFQRNKKSQIFSTLVVVFVLAICVYSLALSFTERPKLEKATIAPLSILDLYNQEQDLNHQYFDYLKEAIYTSYIEMVQNNQFISQNCLFSGDRIDLDSNCYLLSDADTTFSDSVKGYLKTKNLDFTIEISNNNIVAEGQEQTLTSQSQQTFFPFSTSYNFKPKFSYPLSTFFVSSFSKIKNAVETCKTKKTTEEIQLCMDSNLEEMNSNVIKHDNEITLIIKPNVNLLNARSNNLLKPEIKLQFNSV